MIDFSFPTRQSRTRRRVVRGWGCGVWLFFIWLGLLYNIVDALSLTSFGERFRAFVGSGPVLRSLSGCVAVTLLSYTVVLALVEFRAIRAWLSGPWWRTVILTAPLAISVALMIGAVVIVWGGLAP